MKVVLKNLWNKVVRAVRAVSAVAMHRPKVLFLAGIIIGSFIGHTISVLMTEASYKLTNESVRLIGDANPLLADKLKLDKNMGAYRFNAEAVTPEMSGETDPSRMAALLASQKQQTGGGGKDTQNLYSLDLPIDSSQGTKIYDVNSKTSFRLTPEFDMGAGRTENGRVVYPLNEGGQAVYTVKSNGIKEDIVLQKPRGDGLSFKYTLELPKTLEARLDDRGNLGIYSVDPAVSSAIAGALQNDAVSPDTERLKDVQQNGTKDHLVYLIPSPTIVQSGAHPQSHTAKAMYKLNGNQLTVETTGLEALTYPISIDPTVVVTSTGDFTSGNNEGMIQFDTDAISRAAPTAGAVGTWSTTSSVLAARTDHTSVVYNGYVYVIGGSNALNSIEYAPLNSDGTIGGWVATTNTPVAINYHSSVAYNGYLYVIGGDAGSGATGAVYYAPLNANGTVGAWATTSSLIFGRMNHRSVVYNGYVYTIGGGVGANSAVENVEYAPLNANGTVGAWSYTTSLPFARMEHSANVYNGFVYVLGGDSGTTDESSVYYAQINANGTLGGWTSTTSLPGVSSGHTTVTHRGYLYLLSAFSRSAYYALINADGTIGAWTATSSLNLSAGASAAVAYNGYLYRLSGYVTSFDARVEYAKIDQAAQPVLSMGSWNSTTIMGAGGGNSTARVTTRANHGSTTYNGYIYVVGGVNPAGTIITSVHYAPLNAGGGIGAWAVNGTSLPAARAGVSVIAVNGYIYAIGGQDSTGAYATTSYYAPINANGSVGTWTTTTVLTSPRSDAGIINYNGYMYFTGGLTTGNGLVNTVQYAAINANGTLGTWTATTNLTVARATHASTVHNGNLYVIGGNDGIFTSTVLYAPLNANGTVGTWSSTTSLPNARGYMDAQVFQGHIFIAGGNSGGGVYNGTSYYAKVNADGTLGAWQTGTTFAGPRSGHGTDIYDGYIYVTGGTDGASYFGSNFYAALTYAVPASTAGTASPWQSATATNLAIYGHAAVTYGNFIYLVSGWGGGYRKDVRYAPISDNGTIGTWTTSPSVMNLARFNGAAAVHRGYLYVTGGQQATGTFTNTTEYAPINSDGTIGAWTTSSNTFTTARHGHVTVVYNGKLYVIGGGDAANVALGDVKYASINADGSIGAWTDTTATAANRDTDGFVYGGRLYILGGLNGTTYSNTIRYAQINSDGTLGTWVTSGSTFTNARSRMAAVAVNGYVYMSGGGTSSPFGDLQYAPINNDGTIGTWKSSNSLSAVSGAPAGYYYHSMASYKGRLYSLAGMDGTATAFTSSYVTTLNAPILRGEYSRQINLGQLSTLNSVSMNGLTPPDQNVILFRTAGVDGIYGAWRSPSVLSGAPISNVQYVMYKVALDDSFGTAYSASVNASSVTDVTLDYTIMPTLNTENRLRQNKYFDGSGVLQPLQTQ